jgi:D-alanyl-D-alanine dipeptidase
VPASPDAGPHTATTIPPVSARARAAGLVDVRTVVPDAILDLRYATTHNFTHQQLYPDRARCLVHTSMRPGLRAAAAALRRQGLLLVFWDCYRPHAVQVRMYRIVPNPAWVAKPGPYATSHESGRSVDVTLARRAVGGTCAHRVQRHCQLIMGTAFDDFTARAYAYSTSGISRVAVRNRATLRRAMATDGLTVYSGEWWHFDGPGSFVHRAILDSPPY